MYFLQIKKPYRFLNARFGRFRITSVSRALISVDVRIFIIIETTIFAVIRVVLIRLVSTLISPRPCRRLTLEKRFVVDISNFFGPFMNKRPVVLGPRSRVRCVNTRFVRTFIQTSSSVAMKYRPEAGSQSTMKLEM